jgi:hypothetical protein
MCARRNALSLTACARARAEAVRRRSEVEEMPMRLSSCATAPKRVDGAGSRVRPKGATRRRATWRASIGVCSRKAVSGDAKDSRQWRSGCSEKTALLVGDGVDEGLKKKESYTAAKGKSRRPPNAAELKLENSRTRELEN